MIKNWEELEQFVTNECPKDDEYVKRLNFEIKEIIKQGANEYWIDLVNSGKKFDHNKNGLVIAFLLKITDIDPIKGKKALFINGNDKIINGVEITLENNIVINTSEYTMIKTKRGYVAAIDLLEDDEVCLD